MEDAPSRGQVIVDEWYKPTKLFNYVQKKIWPKQYNELLNIRTNARTLFLFNKAEEGNGGNGSSGSLRGTGQANHGQTKRVETASTLLPIMQACYNRPPAMLILRR